ncbi:MAG: CBS domain-containing protein [Acidobacteria bacterium]|nr:CBS domain-containing protein [Acidobacteriota bacterium]
MKVSEIMTKKVECIAPNTTISKAAELMRDHDIGFLPVCDNDRLAGTVTDRDITIRSVAQGRDPRLAPISEIMSQSVFYCYEDDDVEKVGREMQNKEVRRMLILNRDKRLVGVVSLGDIAKTSGEKELAGETLGDIAEAA